MLGNCLECGKPCNEHRYIMREGRMYCCAMCSNIAANAPTFKPASLEGGNHESLDLRRFTHRQPRAG